MGLRMDLNPEVVLVVLVVLPMQYLMYIILPVNMNREQA